MSKIRFIKKDAVVDIKIGTSFLQSIQKLLIFIANDLTEEQLDEYKKQAEAKQPFTEEWMEHLTTISVLLKEIEDKAVEQDLTYEGDISEIDNVLTEEQD